MDLGGLYDLTPEIFLDIHWQKQPIFRKLEQQGLRELFCIIIHKWGFEPYVKFCLRTHLGCRGVEMGLFDYTMIGKLRVGVLSPEIDWKTALWHLPCARDLVWRKQ